MMSNTHSLLSIPTKILLPVDFSPSSRVAVDMAADLAIHFHAEMLLVHVIPQFPTTSLPDLEIEERFIHVAQHDADKRLGLIQSDLADRGLKAAYCIESGADIATCIMQAAMREHTGLIVISTHGISGWHPFIFGSTAEKIIRLVKCPLLLLHSAAV